MTWAHAFSIVGGAFALALMFVGLMHGGWPDIHIHKHYHNKRKEGN